SFAILAYLPLRALRILRARLALPFQFRPLQFPLVNQGSAFSFQLVCDSASLDAGFFPIRFHLLQFLFQTGLLFVESSAARRKLANLVLMFLLSGAQGALGLLQLALRCLKFRGPVFELLEFLPLGFGEFLMFPADLLAG